MGRGSRGRGRMDGNRPGIGPGGYCLCPNCGEKIRHEVGKPCYEIICPSCGSKMTR
jgi:predicted amidophosphoribosyltransferase